MGTRRGHGEGSIYYRESDGKWCSVVDLGYVNGKRKRKVLYGKTRKEVAEKLKIVLREQQQGLPIMIERQTLGHFLSHWLADVVAPNKRPKTYRSYEQIVRCYLQPVLGHHQLTKLTSQHVQAMLKAKTAEGLSPRSVQRIRDVLRNALNHAYRWELVSRNVALLVEPPRIEPTAIHLLTLAQARVLFEQARGDRLEAVYRVALSLGMRQGEILGLRWQDIDFETRVLRVAFALQAVHGKLQLVKPKTAHSDRTLQLPATLVQVLKAHRTRQLEERLLAGDQWQEHGLVFTTRVGTPIHPRNLMRSFYALLKRAALPPMRFHDLRHSCASLLAAQGIPARVAMEILGHSDIRLTQNIYTHIFDEAKQHAADVMDRLFAEDGVRIH
jgi:integrase